MVLGLQKNGSSMAGVPNPALGDRLSCKVQLQL